MYGATMENIVDDILFVTDMDTAFKAAQQALEGHKEKQRISR